jgi:pimeloyl-ACP methyl ester carboxylesterase/GAF domain-containing protein
MTSLDTPWAASNTSFARTTSLKRAAEAQEQQLATAEILRAISQSRPDLQLVLDAIVRRAVELCHGFFGVMTRYDGRLATLVAHHNMAPEAVVKLRRVLTSPPTLDTATGRALLRAAVDHTHDLASDAASPAGSSIAQIGGFRTNIAVPLLRDGQPIGSISVARRDRHPFSDSEIGLLKTFADQAVIAVENVRLVTELQEKNRALTEALERQTATADILRIISRSQTDVQPVFDTIADSALRLLRGWSALILLYDGERLHLGSARGGLPDSEPSPTLLRRAASVGPPAPPSMPSGTGSRRRLKRPRDRRRQEPRRRGPHVGLPGASEAGVSIPSSPVRLKDGASAARMRRDTSKWRFVLVLAILSANSGCSPPGAMGDGDNVSTLESRPLQSGHAPVNGIDMYYEVHGRDQGVPLVLLHGGGSTIQVTFSRVLPVLAGRRRVIALEEQAHGRTTDRDAPVAFESSADDVAALLRYLKVDQADIFGFSNGASVALQVALRHPQLVRKLVFASSMTRRAGARPQLWELMKQADFSNMPQLKTMHDKDAARMQRFTDVPDDALRSVRAPTLIVLGDRDIVTPEHALELTRLISGARLLILPGGHGDYLGEAVMTQKQTRYPELTARLIEEFLDAPERDGPMRDVQHVSVSIARPPAEVYEFASDPRNLPRWAAGLARSEVRRDGDEWIADAPFGRVRVRFAQRNSFGVMDHDVTLESGVTIHNPMRVVPHGDGSELVFTLIRRPGMSDGKFAEDKAAVEHDLKALKDLLEHASSSRAMASTTG